MHFSTTFFTLSLCTAPIALGSLLPVREAGSSYQARSFQNSARDVEVADCGTNVTAVAKGSQAKAISIQDGVAQAGITNTWDIAAAQYIMLACVPKSGADSDDTGVKLVNWGNSNYTADPCALKSCIASITSTCSSGGTVYGSCLVTDDVKLEVGAFQELFDTTDDGTKDPGYKGCPTVTTSGPWIRPATATATALGSACTAN